MLASCVAEMRFFWFFWLLLLSGCASNQTLYVQVHRISAEDFASAHVGTPDPGLDQPLVGEELLIVWSLSSDHFCQTHTQLRVRLRFTKGQDREQIVPVQNPKGEWAFPNTGASYQEYGQIEAYLVQIFQNGQPLAEQKHALWVERIVFTDTD